MPKDKMGQIRLENQVSDMILEVANAYDELTTSDLQGVAGAMAKKLISLLGNGESKAQLDSLLGKIAALNESASTEGCSEDLTVVGSAQLHALTEEAGQLQAGALASADEDEGSKQDIVQVQYWNSVKYYETPDMGAKANGTFLMGITDKRSTNGQLFVDIAADGGDIDDLLSATFEVNRLPGAADDVQCMHLHFDESNLAVSIFKKGDTFIVRPETDVVIRDYVLPNGEQGYIIE